MRTLTIPSTSTYVADQGLLIMSANNYFSKSWKIDKCQLLLLEDMSTEECTKLAEFQGKTNALFAMTKSSAFLGIDNALLISHNLKSWKEVLKSESQQNMFWHMAETKDGTLFVQEYGRRFTQIYKSTDCGETWRPITNCRKIDMGARHFHSLTYDRYRDLLVVTLGDGNRVKIAVSRDQGDTWDAFYTYAYQCLPIVPLNDSVVFGMDSAISSGIVMWDPSRNQWSSIHLRYVGEGKISDNLQSADLKRLRNGIWIMTTGGGSLLISEDLRNWHCCILGSNGLFESHMISNENNGVVAVAMGDTTILFDFKTFNMDSRRDIKQHYALLGKIRGLVYVLKRLPERVK